MSTSNVTLAQLRTFVAVAEAGSFTGAAGVLRMTQPGVSHTIAALEKELGVAVVSRDRGGVVPTEVGERVLVHAREALSRVEQLGQEAAASTGLLSGRVRIGSFPSAAGRLLPAVVGAFERRYPGIEVVLVEGTDEEVRGMISSRAVDVGFVALPVEGLETVAVSEDAMLVVLPEGHALAREKSVGVAQVANEPFVMSRGGCEPLIRAAFRSSGLSPKVRFRVRDMGTILALVGEGLGVTLAPELALPQALPGLRAVPLDPPVRRRIALAVRSLSDAAPAVGAFVEQTRTTLGVAESTGR